MAKKLYIKTFGCQMNVYDSTRMADALAPAGYESVDGPEDADLVLLNTCHIREKAAEKVYSELGRLRAHAAAKAEAGGRMTVGVAGCVAQAEGAEIMRRAPGVDLVVGPQAYHRLPDMVARSLNGERGLIEDSFPVEDKFARLPKPVARGPAAFLTVQEGCDKFCAFCVVPYTRGAEFSRPVERVLSEARALAAGGVREVTLLGQNVNAYHGAGADGADHGLGALIRALAAVEGIERIRYTTSHPNDMDDALIAAHAEVPELMPYLHLPVQSGSDRILKAMNRKHTAQSYIDLIARIRQTRADMAVSGDFIVGFPGETEADFEDTMALVRTVRYASAYSFKYSPRPGTPAAEAEQLPEAVKTERLHRLQALLSEQQAAFQRSCIGMTMDILLEKPGRQAGQMVGRSPYLQPVHLDAPQDWRGRIVRVKIEDTGTNSLSAVLQ